MQDIIHPHRPAHVHRARLFAFATLLTGVLVAGCGGSSPSPTGTGGASASASGATSARHESDTGSGTGPPSALAFAKCMRANGVSNFPDPNAGGGFAFHASGSVSSSPAFKTAQARCQKLLPSGGPLSPGPPPSAQTMTQLLRIAACMRQHGVPQFPDPTTTPPPGSTLSLLGKYRLITNYKGAILLFPATIDMQSPAYQQAQTTCDAAFLGLGPHTGH